jgi:hypothetical protein
MNVRVSQIVSCVDFPDHILIRVYVLPTCYTLLQSHYPNDIRLPISISERSKAGTVYDPSNIGIAGSNPPWGMDVCPRVSVLCCPVSVEALRRADPPSKESYQMSLYVDREAH